LRSAVKERKHAFEHGRDDAEQRLVNIEMYVVGGTKDQIGFRVVERRGSSGGLIATIEGNRLFNIWQGRSCHGVL
jgi:hypothetical protein